MNLKYLQFFESKKKLQEERNKTFSDRTLKYYEQICEMLEREADYGSSFPFLESVYNYIQENEFITDKQCEIVDRISEHPEVSEDETRYGASPF